MNAPTATSTAKWTLALAAVASFMVSLDTLVVSTALSTIRTDLGASIEQLEWTVNAYNLTFAVLLMAGAAIGDRFGRRRTLALGLGAFTVASALCALAPSIGWLIGARALQGAGAAFVLPLALTVVSEAYAARAPGLGDRDPAGADRPGRRQRPGDRRRGDRRHRLGVDLLAQRPDRRWSRSRSCCAGSRRAAAPTPALDLPGLGLLMAGAFGIVWGLVRGNGAGWDSFEVIGSLVAGIGADRRLRRLGAPRPAADDPAAAVSVARVLGRERRQLPDDRLAVRCGLLPRPVPADRARQRRARRRPAAAPWTATLFFVAPVAGSLADRFGERPFAAAGLGLQAAGMAWIAVIADPGMDYLAMVPPLMIAGAGVSMAMPAIQSAVIGSVGPGEVGKASGVNNTMRELGGVFGIAALAAVFTAAGSYASPQDFVDGFAPAIAVTGAFSLLGGIAGLLIPGRATTTEEEPPMKTSVVRYRVKSDQVERNRELVRAVYDELHRSSPKGIAYSTYELDDGTFVHVAEENGEKLTDLDAFAEFREGIAERCEDPPVALAASEVGSYRPGQSEASSE